MGISSYTLSHQELGIKTNKDISKGQLLSLYRVHRAGQIKGHGLFAKRDIFKNEEIIRAVGPKVNSQVSNTLYYSYGIDVLIQVGKDKWVLPNNESRFINHSCEPNLGLLDNGVFVAMKNIKKGEELTFDYATIDVNSKWSIVCHCDAKSCRGKITSQDLLDKKLHLIQRYRGFIANFILKELENRN